MMTASQHAINILDAWKVQDQSGLGAALESASRSRAVPASSRLESERGELLDSIVDHLGSHLKSDQVPLVCLQPVDPVTEFVNKFVNRDLLGKSALIPQLCGQISMYVCDGVQSIKKLCDTRRNTINPPAVWRLERCGERVRCETRSRGESDLRWRRSCCMSRVKVATTR